MRKVDRVYLREADREWVVGKSYELSRGKCAVTAVMAGLVEGIPRVHVFFDDGSEREYVGDNYVAELLPKPPVLR